MIRDSGSLFWATLYMMMMMMMHVFRPSFRCSIFSGLSIIAKRLPFADLVHASTVFAVTGDFKHTR